MNGILPKRQPAAGVRPDTWRSEPATDSQLNYLRDLLKHSAEIERVAGRPLGPVPENVTRGQLSDAISWCKRQLAYGREHPAPVVVEPSRPPVAEGFWMMFGSDRVFKVQRALENGNLYAKVLGDDGDFRYQSGLLAMLAGADLYRVPLEVAANYGALYGRCMICGRRLTDEVSIAAGIGPRCAGKMGW